MRCCLLSLRSFVVVLFCSFYHFAIFLLTKKWCFFQCNLVCIHSPERNWFKCLVAHRKREKEIYFKTILLLLLLFICLFTLFKINGLIGWKRDCESILYDVFMRSASFSALQYLSRWIAGYNISTLLHIVIC